MLEKESQNTYVSKVILTLCLKLKKFLKLHVGAR